MSTDPDVQKALEVARALIKGGVPVFAAEPCPEGCPETTLVNRNTGERKPHAGGLGKYHLPKAWEKTVPSEVWLERWQPGWALAAVGGHVCDFLDGDPRNGGDDSLRELVEGGIFPLSFGQQKTPSGGNHWVIAATGLRKATGKVGGFLPGLDLQAGAADGEGRGFVWIAPTVRISKATGEPVAYRWEVEPDLDLLAEVAEAGDTGTDGIISLITANRTARNAPKPRESAPGAAYDPDDPFLSPGQAAGLVFGDRAFSLAEAQDFVRGPLIELQKAQVGEIEEHANIAAATLSHFVPEFWSADQAFALLEHSLSITAYDPNGPSDWTAEKFRPVLDGRRPPLDAWKAARKAEAPTPPVTVVEAEPGEENLTTVEKLRRRLVTMKELSELPPPKPLVHGLLNLNTESWLIGAPGSLKSFIALDIAGAVARGVPWQGHRTEKRNVLYVAAEGQTGMVLRSRAYIEAYGHVENVIFLPYPVQVKSNDGQWDALVQIAPELDPGLIVLDTQARISVGLEENSATDMGILIAAVGKLKRATGACVLVVHHTGRNGGDARGSSALDGAQDTELKVTRAEPRESLVCTVKQDKQKDMSEGNSRGIDLVMKVVPLGQDGHGQEISSLVVDPDHDAVEVALRALQGATPLEEEATEKFAGRPTEEWTKQVPGIDPRGKLQRYILQTLADHAYDIGLTQAETRRVVIARWYPKDAKGRQRTPDNDSWTDGWKKIISLPIACNVGSEKWALDQVELARLKAIDPFIGA